jgi:phosphoenolpyruvate-protein kinase (PTS system EI component)
MWDILFRKHPVGAMIETKNILNELEELSLLLNFFSIGTNDLALFCWAPSAPIRLRKIITSD